ncbi:uncharacterized protein LOC144904521 [Branchiostoma floridae x Branchiostoma belcheri]
MLANCPLSCGQCGSDTDDCDGVTCQNGGTCVDGDNTYTCDCVSGYVGDHCETQTDCSDSSPHCGYWASIGDCENNAGYMLANCPLSCGVCTSDTDDCDGVTCQNGGTCVDGDNTYTCDCVSGYEGDHCETQTDCSDSSPHCGYWASIGDCENNAGYMLANCPLSCGVCTSATVTTAQPTTPSPLTPPPNTLTTPPRASTTPAAPTFMRNAAWVVPGYRVNERAEVILLCAAAGGIAPGPPAFSWSRRNAASLPAGAVVDPDTGTLRIPSALPEDDGEYTCTADDGFEVVSNGVSFDVCPEITDCADSSPHCGYWASLGDCESNPGYMDPNCPLSCGKCHPDLPPDCLTSKRGVSWETWECNDVTSVPDDVRTELNLDPFYQKYLHAYGIPILGSSILSDDALRRCCYDVLFMLADRRDIRDSYFNVYGRAAIMAQTEVTQDIPEHAHMDESFNTRARGLGGTVTWPVSTGAEENVLCFQNDSYKVEDIFMHEFAHGVHNMAARIVIPDFDSRLQAAYADALANGRFANTYADDTVFEYWAEGVQSYFYVNHESDPPDGIHNHVDTREELMAYDPVLYNLIHEIFPCENYVVNRCVRDYGTSQIKLDCKNGIPRTTIAGSTIFQ